MFSFFIETLTFGLFPSIRSISVIIVGVNFVTTLNDIEIDI